MSARACSACGQRARKLRRAFVLALNSVKPGRVCTACARLGWLLVLGGDPANDTRRRRSSARASKRTLVMAELERLRGAE